MEKIMSITRVMAISVVCLFLLGYSTGVNAQTAAEKPYPVIGQPCPPFLFDDVVNYKSTQLSSKDLNNQYYILDFWAQTCVGCIQGFPHSNEMQKRFEGKLKIILVCYADNKKKIKTLYQNISKRENLQLTCALDTQTMNEFLPDGYHFLPSLVWINNKGIVVAVSYGEDLTEEKINAFIHDMPFKFHDKSIESQKKENVVSEKSVDSFSVNDKDATVFRSEIKRWQPGMGSPKLVTNLYKNDTKIKYYNYTNVTLKNLLKALYLPHGEWDDTVTNRQAILELRDSSKFFENGDEIKYCLMIQTPGNESMKSVKEKACEVIKTYLNFNADMIDRKLPCYFLRVSNLEKLKRFKSNGLKPANTSTWEHGDGGDRYSQSMFDLAILLGGDIELKVIDDTHVNFKVDFPLYVITTNIDEINKGLSQYGLELVLGQKNFKTLVIRN